MKQHISRSNSKRYGNIQSCKQQKLYDFNKNFKEKAAKVKDQQQMEQQNVASTVVIVYPSFKPHPVENVIIIVVVGRSRYCWWKDFGAMTKQNIEYSALETFMMLLFLLYNTYG